MKIVTSTRCVIIKIIASTAQYNRESRRSDKRFARACLYLTERKSRRRRRGVDRYSRSSQLQRKRRRDEERWRKGKKKRMRGKKSNEAPSLPCRPREIAFRRRRRRLGVFALSPLSAAISRFHSIFIYFPFLFILGVRGRNYYYYYKGHVL